MSDFSAFLTEEILRLHADVAGKLVANDQRATGNTIARLRTEAFPNMARLLGPGHSRFLQDGRGPGGVSVQSIREWIQAKRLQLNPYAVAEKISREGTALFRGEDPRFTKPTDSFAGPIAAALPRFREGLKAATRSGLRSDLLRALPAKLS